tara:strand:+ start:38 stop:181 length:144 start_codon:yes stop_codon:yes gene_type:complete
MEDMEDWGDENGFSGILFYTNELLFYFPYPKKHTLNPPYPPYHHKRS